MLAASLERYRDELIEEGIEKGIEKDKQEIAIRMMENGADIKFVSEMTKLSIEQIEELLKK